jgi:hypothetical protein
MHHVVARDLWEALDWKYAKSDVRREPYVNDQYHEYTMVDGRFVMEQANEIQFWWGNLSVFGADGALWGISHNAFGRTTISIAARWFVLGTI